MGTWVLTERHRTTTWEYFIGDTYRATFADTGRIGPPPPPVLQIDPKVLGRLEEIETDQCL